MSQSNRSKKEDKGRRSSSPSPTRSIRSSLIALPDRELHPDDSISQVSSNRGTRSQASISSKSTRRSEPRKEQSLQKQMFKHRLDRINEDDQDERSAVSQRSDRSELRNKDSKSSYSRDSHRRGRDSASSYSKDSRRSGNGAESSYSRSTIRGGNDAESSYSRDSRQSGADSLRGSRAKTEHRSQFSDYNSKAIVRHRNNDREYQDNRSAASRSTVRPLRRDRDIDETTSLMSRARLTAADQQLILRNKQNSAYDDDDHRSQSSCATETPESCFSRALNPRTLKPGDEVNYRSSTRVERINGKNVIHKEEDVTVRRGAGSDSGRTTTTTTGALSDNYSGVTIENRAPRGSDINSDRATSTRLEQCDRQIEHLRQLLPTNNAEYHESSYESHNHHHHHHHTSSCSETHSSCCHHGGEGGGSCCHHHHGCGGIVVLPKIIPAYWMGGPEPGGKGKGKGKRKKSLWG